MVWQKGEDRSVYLARPDCAQISAKSTPRRSSDANAVISSIQVAGFMPGWIGGTPGMASK